MLLQLGRVPEQRYILPIVADDDEDEVENENGSESDDEGAWEDNDTEIAETYTQYFSFDLEEHANVWVHNMIKGVENSTPYEMLEADKGDGWIMEVQTQKCQFLS